MVGVRRWLLLAAYTRRILRLGLLLT
jgi:hypothetical protein